MKRPLVIALSTLVLVAGAGLAAIAVLAPVNLPVLGMIFGSRAGFDDDATLAARVTMADGYKIAIYAAGLGDARLMQIAADGSILVSVPGEGWCGWSSPTATATAAPTVCGPWSPGSGAPTGCCWRAIA